MLQYAKLRMLELYYKFLANFWDTEKYEEMKMDTDSLYLALAGEELYDCIRSKKRKDWELLRSKDCNDSFTADAYSNFFPRSCCSEHKRDDKKESGLIMEEICCNEMFCLCSKTYCCYASAQQIEVQQQGTKQAKLS